MTGAVGNLPIPPKFDPLALGDCVKFEVRELFYVGGFDYGQCLCYLARILCDKYQFAYSDMWARRLLWESLNRFVLPAIGYVGHVPQDMRNGTGRGNPMVLGP